MGSWENCWTQTTYTWNQTGTASWDIDANWTPTRTTPATNDILQFNNGATTTTTNIPTQTIGQLLVNGSTTVNLQGVAIGTILTVGGGTGTDLTIASGSALNINVAINTTTITLATGATGSIDGNMTFSSAAHKFTAVDASAVTFNSGGTFTAGTGFTSNPFGTGTANSVVFSSGSTYFQIAGANPFGLNAPASVVVFQSGSLFKVTGSGQSPAFNGRTYANIEFAGSGNSTMTGSTAVSMDNLTITSGTVTIGMTGTPGHSIKGNIAVNGGSLSFNAFTSGTMNLNSSSNQTVTGSMSATTNQTINVASGTTIDFGTTGVFTGAGTFNLSSGVSLKTANSAGINSSGPTGSVQTTTRIFSSGANYEFQGAATGIFTTTPDANTVNNLTINAGSGVALGQDLSVAGTLTLTAGRFNIGSFNLISNTISGTATWGEHAAKYIIAEGSGKLSRNNGTNVLFPIGTSADYIPCRINGGSGTFSVNLSAPTSGLDATKILLKQWNLTGGGGSPDMSFQWLASVEGSNFPTTGDIKLFKNNGSWAVVGTVAVPTGSPRTATFTGIACCSGFTVGAENALPVELVIFKGILANKKVNLTWQTASELNNSHFSIEKSTNGTSFREIGTVQGKGTSYELNDYSFTDESPARGLNYYRLKQLDFDGNFEYSKVVSVNFVGGKGQVQLFPTVASHEIQVRFPAPREEAGTIQFFDQSGKLVKLVSFDAELSDLPISVEEFQRGVYFVKVQNGQLFETLRFVRQ